MVPFGILCSVSISKVARYSALSIRRLSNWNTNICGAAPNLCRHAAASVKALETYKSVIDSHTTLVLTTGSDIYGLLNDMD
jgi:hypothetical protein